MTTRLNLRPGINAQLTQIANESGWFACNRIRWKPGTPMPEKVGGWQRLISTVCAGFIRAMHAWEDLENEDNLILGTDGGAQLVVDGVLHTFQLLSGSITSSGNTIFSASIGSAQITVTQNEANVAVGQSIVFAMTASIGHRIIPAGSTFVVTSIVPYIGPPFPGVVIFTFNMTQVALINETTSGNPILDFTNLVGTVTLPLHGLIAGGSFTFQAQTSVIDTNELGSGTINLTIPAGTVVTVQAPVTANTFNFDLTPFGTNTRTFTVSTFEGVNSGASNPNLSTAPVLNVLGTPPASPENWFADNLGQTGLISFTNSALYAYTPPISAGVFLVQVGNASAGATAPQIMFGFFTAMPQAQIIAFGTEPILGSGVVDPLLVRFSDAGSYTDWTATVTNQAGSYRLSRGSKIIAGLQAPQTTLLWTDVDIWAMNYQGPPLIYGFTTLATGCGIVGPKARCSIGRLTIWQGQNNFWVYGDNGVQPLPCDVWDIFFKDLDTANIQKCFMGANSSFGEVWCFYPSISGGTGECDKYIKVNLWLQPYVWDYGDLVRTVWEDNSIFGPPLAGDGNFRIQQHEIGYDDDDVAMAGVFAESGYASMQSGTGVMGIDRMEPDLKWFGTSGSVAVTLVGINYSGGNPEDIGPFTVTPTTTYYTMHTRYRFFAMKVAWASVKGFSARIAAIAFGVKGAGTRP